MFGAKFLIKQQYMVSFVYIHSDSINTRRPTLKRPLTYSEDKNKLTKMKTACRTSPSLPPHTPPLDNVEFWNNSCVHEDGWIGNQNTHPQRRAFQKKLDILYHAGAWY